jgi:methylmalonyl-CoA mutase N-terminal domain/subunit
VAYVEAAKAAGLDVDDFGPRLSFFFAAHNDFLEEIAKFRAARRLWAHLMRDRFGATTDRACQLRFHTQTAGSTLTARQPDNNIVRVALQALAAVLGGTQSLHCNGRDEALALPTEDAARIALRTQQVIAAETGVASTVDPVGGAWAIEARTAAIEEEALRLLAAIEAAGGTVAALEAGVIQRQIQDAAYEAQQQLDRGETIVVGVNAHETGTAPPITLHRVDPAVEAAQTARLAAARAGRDTGTWRHALDAVRDAARSDANLLPHIVTAVEARATVGEIAGALRDVFGEHHDDTF